MNGLSCQKCKGESFDPKYSIDELYVCTNCGTITGCYCRGCGRMYNPSRFGFHGDVYECKLCGKIQWGYTEYTRAGERK